MSREAIAKPEVEKVTSPTRSSMLKRSLITNSLLLLACASPAIASPSDWRTPEADAAFVQRFSDSEIKAFEGLPYSDETTPRAAEAKKLIAEFFKEKPEIVYGLANQICDQMVLNVPRFLLATTIMKAVRTYRADLHPLTVKYFAENMVNASYRVCCPSLKGY